MLTQARVCTTLTTECVRMWTVRFFTLSIYVPVTLGVATPHPEHVQFSVSSHPSQAQYPHTQTIH